MYKLTFESRNVELLTAVTSVDFAEKLLEPSLGARIARIMLLSICYRLRW